MANDRFHFVATLAREIPDLAPHHVADLAAGLIRYGAKASRDAVKLCNGELDQDEYERARHRTAATIDALLKYFSDLEYMAGRFPKIGYAIGGDPRGFSLKLRLPSKISNTWGGEEAGYGVPGS